MTETVFRAHVFDAFPVGEFVGILHLEGTPLPVEVTGYGVREIVLIGQCFRRGLHPDVTLPERQHRHRLCIQGLRKLPADAVQECGGHEGDGAVHIDGIDREGIDAGMLRKLYTDGF